jgi:hypothetical protein
MLGAHWFAVCVGVASNDENPCSLVRSADILSADRHRKAAIAGLFQLAHDCIKPEVGPACDVLDDNPSRLKLSDDASELTPQTRALSSKAAAISCAGHVLAGEAAADEIHGSKSCFPNSADIVEPFGAWPVLRKRGPAVCVLLDLPHDRAKAGPLEPEFQATDTAE